MAEPALVVCCLCAEWCSNCREYRRTFDAVERAFGDIRFRWVDIEDESDLVGELDVVDFPTILVACEGRAKFFGAITPQPEVLTRLVEAHRSEAGAPLQDEKMHALASRLAL
jgi:thiol-disulfide isomerase/thioredoxin